MRGMLFVMPATWLLGAWLTASLAAPPPALPPATPSALLPAPLVRHEASRLSMGSVYAIAAYDDDGAVLPRLLEEALDEVDRLDRLMSHYRQESPLSQLNRTAAANPVEIDGELFDLIAEALRYSEDTQGAFDITVGPLMKTWGFFKGDTRVPTDRELRGVLERVGYRHVRLNDAESTIHFDRVGVELDLGGIAKGYAVDRVARLLKARGVEAALVSAGGSTLYGYGAPPEREAWEVTVQDPLDASRTALTLPLRDRALSIAGRSEKSFEVDGVVYSHIMDPRTGRPVQGMLSVAVLAATGTAGDALDNALFVQGVEQTRAWLSRHPAVEALFFLPAAASGSGNDAARKWTLVRLPR